MIMLEHTPIEEYTVDGITVHVKRDDLFDPVGRNGKMRGIVELFSGLKGNVKIGVYDTSVSRAGLGVAGIAHNLFPNVEVHLYFPKRKKDDVRPEHKQAEKLGAILHPLTANSYANVLYYRARKSMDRLGGRMLPLGLTTVESVRAVAREAATIPPDLLTGTLVLCVGTGTITAGVLAGISRVPDRIIGVSCGMSIDLQMKRIKELLKVTTPFVANPALNNLKLVMGKGAGYYYKETIECPWDTDPYYDRKAYRWMVENIKELKTPIFFWSIG